MTFLTLEELEPWTAARVRSLLSKSDAAVLRALTQLYSRQLPQEQSSHASFASNGIGFSAGDAARCTKYAQAALTQGWLPQPDIELLRPVMMKYTRQLLEIIASNQTKKDPQNGAPT